MSSARTRSARLAAAVALLLAMALPAQAANPSRQQQERAVHGLLRAHHPTITADSLRKIGPDVASILLKAAAQPNVTRMSTRGTALLVHFPSEKSAALLRLRLHDRRTPIRIRRIAGVALIRGQGVAVASDVRKMLHHVDPHLRDGAANALGTVVQPQATRWLEQRLALERERFVRETISRSLQRHRKARSKRGSQSKQK